MMIVICLWYRPQVPDLVSVEKIAGYAYDSFKSDVEKAGYYLKTN